MSNHAFAAPILPASVKTVTPTFNRIPEVKPSTNFETAKKPVVVESNIGNTRIKDNGSNLAPTTVSQTFFSNFVICELFMACFHEFTNCLHDQKNIPESVLQICFKYVKNETKYSIMIVVKS